MGCKLFHQHAVYLKIVVIIRSNSGFFLPKKKPSDKTTMIASQCAPENVRNRSDIMATYFQTPKVIENRQVAAEIHPFEDKVAPKSHSNWTQKNWSKLIRFWDALLGTFWHICAPNGAHSLRVPYSKPMVNAKKNHQNDGKSFFVNSFHFHPGCSVVPPTTSCALSRPLEHFPTFRATSTTSEPRDPELF